MRGLGPLFWATSPVACSCNYKLPGWCFWLLAWKPRQGQSFWGARTGVRSRCFSASETRPPVSCRAWHQGHLKELGAFPQPCLAELLRFSHPRGASGILVSVGNQPGAWVVWRSCWENFAGWPDFSKTWGLCVWGLEKAVVRKQGGICFKKSGSSAWDPSPHKGATGSELPAGVQRGVLAGSVLGRTDWDLGGGDWGGTRKPKFEDKFGFKGLADNWSESSFPGLGSPLWASVSPSVCWGWSPLEHQRL